MLAEFDLTGSVALVTGGNSGIGRAIAIGLARAGADIAIAARNEEKTARVVKEIEGLGRQVIGVRCDVTKRDDIHGTVQAVKNAFGKLNILVSNAGVARGGGPPEALSEEAWDLVIDTNLKGSFFFAQAVYPLLVANGGGKIINIASGYALFASPSSLPYGASKAGIVQLTKSLAVAWAKDNIQVNAILPGWVDTDMTAGLRSNKALYDAEVHRTPAGRFGKPEDMVGIAIFLASQASNFMTGQAVLLDGGYWLTK
jgi:2-deoxy-D-gluconate 3-dehydrogenase